MIEFAPDYEREGNLILLPNDVEWRKSLFPLDVMDHPAKLQMHIVKLVCEYFSATGELPEHGRILDPFAGTGTTALAAFWGFQVTLIELEEGYLDILRRMRRSWQEQSLVKYSPVIYSGDSRAILRDMTESSFDLVLTSPPYANLQVGKVKTEFTGDLLRNKSNMGEYAGSVLNFGRLNTFMFNQQMLKVYREIKRVLKPGGYYVSVTKDSMRNGERQRLSSEVIRMCQECGLKYTGLWWKWKPPGSMLQKVMINKGSEVVYDEDIIAFQA